MPLYYVNMNSQPNGDHEVHTGTCFWLPQSENRIYLGIFQTCWAAVVEAQKYYVQVNGCAHCSGACHTG